MKTFKACILLIFHISAIYAQPHNLKFEHLTTEDGLSQSNVMSILQDSRGFMWIGTRDGLNKYDGYAFTVYRNDKDDSTSLSNNTVSDILEDSTGNLWIATYRGLNMFDRKSEKFIRYQHDENDPASIAGNLINSILIDSQGDLWIGIENQGLDRYDKKTNGFIHYKYEYRKNDLALPGDYTVKKIFEDKDHNLWIGTGYNGVQLFNKRDKFFDHFQHDDNDPTSISYGAVLAMFQDSKGRIWLGTREEGLNLFIPETKKFRHFLNDDTHANNTVLSLEEDDKGNIWVGMENSGLRVISPATWTIRNYQQREGDNKTLNSNSIYSIYKDSKRNMWLGTFSGGINFVNRDTDKFTHYQEGLSHSNVLSIFENPFGKLWIGTDGGGLNLFDPSTNTFTYFKHEPGNKNSICGNAVLSAIEDSGGNIWVGTWAAGLTVFNNKNNSFKHFQYEPSDITGLGSSNAWAIFEDRDKQIWIGTYSAGLELYDPRTETFIHHQNDVNDPNSISGNTINCIFEDSQGYLWIGTQGDGLNRFDKSTKRFKRFLPEVTVNFINEDRLGNFYLGTDEGLKHLEVKSQKITNYHLKDGLPNEMVFGGQEDAKGNIWLSTNNGLSKFNPSTKTFKNYGEADGVQSKEFKKASIKTRSGWMYFGGINGFNEFFPDSVKEQSFEPPLVLTNFLIFNEEIQHSKNGKDSPLLLPIYDTKEITLSHEYSVFSFEFASLNYTSPEKKQYAYRLEGFDERWNDIGTNHSATYTNLDPGEYVFMVKGLNNEGDWSNKMITLNLTITPPFWKTWWFKSVSAFVLLSGLILAYRIRVGKIKRQKEKLERVVQERTEEIVAQNEQLTEQQEELETQRNSLALQNRLIEEKNMLLENQQLHLEKLVDERTLELLKMNMELKDKNQRFEQYGFMTSHNFRGPVATLLGLCSLINRKDLSASENSLLFDKIRETTQKIDEMIKDMSSLLAQDTQLETLFVSVDLEEVVLKVKSLLAQDLKESYATVTYDFSQVSSIQAVPAYLTSIFYNLISNAIKFKREEVLPAIEIRSIQYGDLTLITFKDNGVGIDLKKHANNIFHPFKRFSTHVPGKGLGLYLVKTQLKAMESEIQIESEEEKGSTFTLIFKRSKTSIREPNIASHSKNIE